MEHILEVNNLSKNNILNDVSLYVENGEMVAVMGPSGSGKSTLLYNISGMDRADSGSVIFDGNDIVRLSEDEKAKVRLNKMGFVFQNMNMLSNLNVMENIMYPAIQSKHADKNDVKTRAISLMEKLGIGGLAQRKITEVSGGQLQRACICRSMINDPDIIFADEPTGALNQNSSMEVMEALKKLNEEGTTLFIVTHDAKVAGMCDRVLFLVDGKITSEWTKGTDISEWLNGLGW